MSKASGFRLHLIGKFEALNAGFELGFPAQVLGVGLIEGLDEIKLLTLPGQAEVLAFDVLNNLVHRGRGIVDQGALVSSGQER